jgi:hypothetical protein
MSSTAAYTKLCVIHGQTISAKGMLVRFGSAKGRPLEEQSRWAEMTKGERRAFRRAAFRAGNRRLAHRSVHPDAGYGMSFPE